MAGLRASGDASARPPRGLAALYAAALALLVASALLQVGIVARSALAVARYARLTMTTGSEELNVYALAKMQAGRPLYEATASYPFSLTPYNFGFYRLYGWILGLLGAHDDGLFVVGRWITFGFALANVALVCRIVRLVLRAKGIAPTTGERAAILAGGWLTAIGANFVGPWAMTMRPDVAALTFELAALLCFLNHALRGGARDLLAAGGLFALAWAVKQTNVWYFLACALFLATRPFADGAWRTRPGAAVRNAILLAAPMAATVLLAVLLLGPHYLDNIVVAQSINGLHLSYFRDYSLAAVVGNLFFFAMFPVAAALGMRRARQAEAPSPLGRLWTIAVPLTGLANFAQSCREGSSKNQLLEIFALAAILSIAALIAAGRSGRGRVPTAAAAACLLLAPLLGASAIMTIAPRRIARDAPQDATSLAKQRRFAAWFVRQPRPAFTTIGVLDQPWHATGGRFPQFVFLSIYFNEAARRGLLAPDYFRRTFAAARTVALAPNDPMVAPLLAAGYRRIEAPLAADSGFMPLVVLER